MTTEVGTCALVVVTVLPDMQLFQRLNHAQYRYEESSQLHCSMAGSGRAGGEEGVGPPGQARWSWGRTTQHVELQSPVPGV